MINYQTYKTDKLSQDYIDDLYFKLLKLKSAFVYIKFGDNNFILTKEKSLFSVDDFDLFLEQANSNVYYKTIFGEPKKYSKKDVELFKRYLTEYKPKMSKVYGNKYLFGSVAVRTNNGQFITTIRGKETLDDYTIVNNVDYVNHIVIVSGEKATLNAPLLDVMFKNPRVKAVVHINHYYDDKLPYYPYAFPGTVRDSDRCNKTSFNIVNHGLVILLDKDGVIF
jgi:hypothetical protein